MAASPESPRWLLANGFPVQAAEAANKLWGSNAVMELGAVAVKEGKGLLSVEADVGFVQMLSMRSFQIGLLLFVFQQFAGINALVYFSTSVFRQVRGAMIARNAIFDYPEAAWHCAYMASTALEEEQCVP